MFRALAGAPLEGYVNPPKDHNEFIQDQTRRFTKQYPQMYLTEIPTTPTSDPYSVIQTAGTTAGTISPQVLANANDIFAIYDPNTRQQYTAPDFKEYATSIEISQQLRDKAARCKTANLDDLLKNQNPSERIRCGWMYSKYNPAKPDEVQVNQGALGTRVGPSGFGDPPNGGTFYWDLEDAKKQILRDRCNRLTSCDSVGTSEYAGCGFSLERGIGIPVTPRGLPLYPKETWGNGGNIVMSADQCPKELQVQNLTPGTPAYEAARVRDVCTPNEEGRLDRDCLLQKVTQAGCKTSGTLYHALQSGAEPNNYATMLEQMPAYKKYQTNADIPLIQDMVRQGRSAAVVALDNFKALARAASEYRETAANFAARDLCLKKGIFDKWDFCLELQDTTPPPYALECVQKEFRKQGGQPAGTLYPKTDGDLKMWNSAPNWGALKQIIANMAEKAKNQDDERVQRRALAQFLGIVRETKPPAQIGIIPGVELLYFASDSGIFLGRRQDQTIPYLERTEKYVNIGNSGRSDRIRWILLTNVRPPTRMNLRLRMDADDGMVLSMNSEHSADKLWGNFQDTQSVFARFYAPRSASAINSICWNFRPQGPNYLMGTWFNEDYGKMAKVLYSDCNNEDWKQFPAQWLTLTQEPDAPMMAFEGMVDEDNQPEAFREYRLTRNYFINYGAFGNRGATPNGVTLVASDKFPNLGAALKFKGNNAFAKVTNAHSIHDLTQMPIVSMNAWKTATLAFVIDSAPQIAGQIYPVFGFGPITIVAEQIPGNTKQVNVTMRWNNANAQGTQTFSSLPVGEPIFAIMNLRSDFANKFPNRFLGNVVALSEAMAGSVSMESFGYDNLVVSTPGNRPICKDQSADIFWGPWRGPYQYPPNVTTDFTIGWFHMFDYELDSADIIRDAKNTWIRAFVDQTWAKAK